MEFFDASPAIAPKKQVSNSLKERRKKKKTKWGGGYMSHSEKSRYSSKDIIPLDELIM